MIAGHPMKHFSAALLATALFAVMLAFPKAVFHGAEEGLLLWYQVIFPTLFPFLVITNLLMQTGGIRMITRIFAKIFCRIFRVSENGSFAVITGFLCGYPMGAKITADLLRGGRISRREASYLLSFCNNTSPVFIVNYIVWKSLGKNDLLLPTLAILYASPILISLITRRFYLKGEPQFPDLAQAEIHRKEKSGFSAVDACMMDSFESIVKVGGYIILFSVLIALIQEISPDNPVFFAVCVPLEVTNGISMLTGQVKDMRICYPAVLALTSFGGVCSAAQTQCMINGTELSVSSYLIQKLAAALAASLLAFLFLGLWQA